MKLNYILGGFNMAIETIRKECRHEVITYTKIDNERVIKRYYSEKGCKVKEKEINVREQHQNRRTHKNVDNFFEDMIMYHGYYIMK